MTDRQIAQFLTVTKYMSITKAAKEIYMSQPALSLSLSKMERELGVELFKRDGNKLFLTAEGECLKENFEHLQKEFEELYERARTFSEHREEYITLGYSGSASTFSTMMMGGIFSSWQSLPVHKIYADTKTLKKLLMEDQVDFIITYPPVVGTQFGCDQFLKEEIVVAVSENHPLASKKKITWKDLSNTHIHMLTKTHSFRQNCDEELRKIGIVLGDTEDHEYADFIRVIDREKYGENLVCFTTEEAFGRNFSEGYCCRRVDDISIYQTTAISWKLNSLKDYTYRGFIDLVKKRYKEQLSKNSFFKDSIIAISR